MTDDSDTLRRTLRRMPVPEPREGFVDAALARAAAVHRPVAAREPVRISRWRAFLSRWETWAGAALGGAVAATLTAIMLGPLARHEPQPVGIALALHEARDIDMLIDSERDLKSATIRVAATGSVVLDGFEDEREIGWQADLARGSNLLSLPVVARSAGKGQIVAIVEHNGRSRRIAVDLTVLETAVSRT